jgi:hypothetical protein
MSTKMSNILCTILCIQALFAQPTNAFLPTFHSFKPTPPLPTHPRINNACYLRENVHLLYSTISIAAVTNDSDTSVERAGTRTRTRTRAAAATNEINHTRSQASFSKTWFRRYEELKLFQKEHGHCSVSRKETSLGNWVQKQRSAYKLYLLKIESEERTETSHPNTSTSSFSSGCRGQSPLKEEQVQLLEEIGFIWNFHEWKYQLNLQNLQSFYKNHGHIHVPNTPEGEHEELYKWLCRRKEEYKKYLSGNDNESNLTNEKRNDLEELGFHIGMFMTGDTNADGQPQMRAIRTFTRTSWDGRFQQLLEFKKEHGHCTVPTNDKTFMKLSGWVQHQRAEKKKKEKGFKSRLTDEREQRLDEIGFVWSIQDRVWNQRLNELREFKSQHGHVRVHTKNGKLGNWVMIQRLQYGFKSKGEKSTLSDKRMEALNELGFEWNLHEISWEEKFDEFKKFKENKINSNVKVAPYLYSWIVAQRAEKRYKQQGLHSHLTAEREAKLDQIDFDWRVEENRNKQREDLWNKNFEKLKEYKNEHGSCRVPVRKHNTREENSFSHWVRDQRRYYKSFVKGTDSPMNEHRQKLLESIGFATDIVS